MDNLLTSAPVSSSPGIEEKGNELESIPASHNKPQCVGKYLARIQEKTAGQMGVLAYRGQRKAHWLLQSAATRRLIRQWGQDVIHGPEFSDQYIAFHHDILLSPARRHGFGVENGRDVSDLQLLAKLQHYGAATGLLDFTWNLLAALWFASQEPHCDGRLFVVNTNDPIHLRQVPADETTQGIQDLLVSPGGTPSLWYWEPMWAGDANNRILRQRSVFIIGRPLIPCDSPVICDIKIPREDKPLLLAELEWLDVSQQSLFQDLYGFAEANSEKQSYVVRDPKDYLREGNRFYQEGKYPKAIDSYSRYIERELESIVAFLLRGNAYAADGTHSKALRDYDAALAHEIRLPRYQRPTVYFNRANSKSELEDYAGALQDYSESIRLDQQYWQSFYNRANAYVDLGRFEEAIADYDRINDLGSSNVDFNRGNALVALGRFEEAVQFYERAALKEENHPGVQQNLPVLCQILSLVHGLEYRVQFPNYPKVLHVEVASAQENTVDSGDENHFLMMGRAGNVGNFGGPRLAGGKGFDGKPLMLVRVRV